MRAERAGVEKFDVIIGGKGRHGVFGVTGWVKSDDGDESGDKTETASSDDAKKGIFGGGKLAGFGAGATFEVFGGFCGDLAIDFGGGTLPASRDGMRN